jgi:ATP/maltotriose-dependent transcriptional regulator MalT
MSGEAVALAEARAALARHDWEAAHIAASRGAAGGAAGADAGAETDADADADAGAAERADVLADAAWWLGRLDECIAARQQAYRLFDQLGDRRRAGGCAVWLWEHHVIAAHPVVGGAWLRRARRALRCDENCVEYGALLLREAEVAHGDGRVDEALDMATRAVTLGRELGSVDLEAEALQTAGRVLIDRGQTSDGLGHLDEAMLFAVEGRLRPYSAGKVYCSLISACEALGDLDRAAEWTEATLRWAERHPFAIFPGICRLHRAVLLKRRGALLDAEREALRACDELDGRHVPNAIAAYAEVGDIRRRLGQLERAEEAFAKAEQLAGRPCGAVAMLRLAQGRTSEALDVITACARDERGLARAPLLAVLVQVAARSGDLDVAAEAVDELDSIARKFDTVELQAMASSARGRLQFVTGEPAGASVVLREALVLWEQLGNPYEAATVRTLLGQVLRDAGDEPGAAEAFRSAASAFEQLGARLDVKQLAERGGRRLFPAGLTAREVQVLQLVAAGKSNREVAAELCLSVKTVSRHLSNIFTKAGVGSRAAATAFAFQHGLVDQFPA